jgi:signal transduction histidine kinase
MHWRLSNPASLRGRLLRDIALACLAACACYALVLSSLYRAGSETLVRNGLDGQWEDVAEALSVRADGTLHASLRPRMQWAYAAYAQHAKFRVIEASQVVLSSEAARDRLAPPAQGRFTTERDGLLLEGVQDTLRIEGRDFTLQVVRSADFLAIAEESILPVVADTALIAGGLACGVFALVVLASVRRALRPLWRASKAAAAIGPDAPSARVPVAAIPAEIRPLVDAVNAGLARLEAAYRSQQGFIANAAHELKTPLAILRARTESPDVDPARMRADIDHMARIVGQMLHLSEASDAHRYRMRAVDLRDVARDAWEHMRFVAEARDIVVAFDLDANPVVVTGDRGALTMAVRNLLDNALRHSPARGVVRIIVRGGAVTVCDAGPGVPVAQRSRVFERFWRADAGSDGAGLGLAIVEEVMRAHGGRAELLPSDDGACFRLAL